MDGQATALATQRTLRSHALIAVPLCAVGGALNAVSFLALSFGTSHVTGSWTRFGGELGTGNFAEAALFLRLALAFLLGAMAATVLIEFDLAATRRIRYLKPLILEILVLVGFVAVGLREGTTANPGLLGCLLGFAMGLQNATITKVSGAAVRTTHMSGATADFGIEMGRIFLILLEYVRARKSAAGRGVFADVRAILLANGGKSLLLGLMVGSFTAGALGGGLAYARWGILGAVPPTAFLSLLVLVEAVFIWRGRPGYYAQHDHPTTRFVRVTPSSVLEP